MDLGNSPFPGHQKKYLHFPDIFGDSRKKTFLKSAVIWKLGKSLVLLKGVTLSGILNN